MGRWKWQNDIKAILIIVAFNLARLIIYISQQRTAHPVPLSSAHLDRRPPYSVTPPLRRCGRCLADLFPRRTYTSVPSPLLPPLFPSRTGRVRGQSGRVRIDIAARARSSDNRHRTETRSIAIRRPATRAESPKRRFRKDDSGLQ